MEEAYPAPAAGGGEAAGGYGEQIYGMEEGAPAPESVEAGAAAEPAAPEESFWAPLKDTRVWGLLAIRGFLALVFFQAAIDHLGVAPAILAGQWAPGGVFAPLAEQMRSNPALFVNVVIVGELLLALSVTFGLLTRIAGVFGLILNAFFFAAFEWSLTGQLYLSWDAGMAALWLVVLLTAPGQYIGFGQLLGRRHPRLLPWVS